jgi:hypothetical protein
MGRILSACHSRENECAGKNGCADNQAFHGDLP